MSSLLRRCCRRRAVSKERAAVEDELDPENDWQLIETPRSVMPNRLRHVVRRVIVLLRVRKLWAQVSSALGTAHVRRNHGLRANLCRVRADLTVKLKGTKVVFAHLERRGGQLRYRGRRG